MHPKEAMTPGDPALEQAPGRRCTLWRGAHTGAGFLAEAVACVWSSLFLKECGEDPQWGSS